MARLTHFAHPQGWTKGESVVKIGDRKVQVERECRSASPAGQAIDGQITFVEFTSEAHRDQWLKWWRKP